MNTPEPTEYRIEHFRDRLAGGELAELGLLVELRGASVLIRGSVPSAAYRDRVLDLARTELAGLAIHADVVVAGHAQPDRAEDLP
ncbi:MULTISPECIES: hypothetical protein [Streptomyces]|uniref:hypothetical protein n=1 Tax=Streptomyces TaxID=1883 RepID=UPI0013166C46|nr:MULTISPECIES: hypothetical protein [Streptomyces]QGZ47723.1 hypothetical protein GPZ77_04385 [Streptomyces sp. QHH-9511]GGT93999.1 hypothetical protein GCM10010272_43660 [Streptomyces lateritius]